MKLANVSADNLKSIRKFEEDEITQLWINDYYDGPLEGMCQVSGEKYKYTLFKESDDWQRDGWSRRYLILRLNEQQLEEEIYWHEQFKRFVGNHWDETPEEKAKGRQVRPKSEHHQFYEPYKAQYNPDFSECEVLGWYQM